MVPELTHLDEVRELLARGRHPEQQLALRMGIELTEWEADRVVATMPADGNRQPFGLLHGGANAVLAETLGSLAAARHAGPGGVVMGLELSCSHHRSVRQGPVTGVCTPLHLGTSVCSHLIDIRDAWGRRTCTARMTCAIRRTTNRHAATE